MTLSPARAAWLLALASLAWGVWTMSRYGVTYDAPSLLYAGDRTLFFLTHPTAPFALDFLVTPLPGFHSDFVLGPSMRDPEHYPVLVGLLCAVTGAIFHDGLHWLSAIDAHHLGLLVLRAITLFFFFSYGRRLLGARAALVASVLLATLPCAVGHSFNDLKDWPSAEMYALTVLAAAAGILEENPRALRMAGVWLGVGLSAKLNLVFAVVTLALWSALVYGARYRRRAVPRDLVRAWLFAPAIGLLVFVVAWPWLYASPGAMPARIGEYVRWMVHLGTSAPRGWSAYPVRCVVYMTPPAVLAGAITFALFGRGESQEQRLVWALVVAWAALPVLRVSWPGAGFYDANRHFLEYVPALCAAGGAGYARALDLATAWLARQRLERLEPWLEAAAATALAACLVVPLAEYHPFETTYFNVLAGGLGGAEKSGVLFADGALHRASGVEGDYWYSSLREGVAAIRANLRPGETFSACGPWRGQVLADETDGAAMPYVGTRDLEGDLTADLLYAAPREGACNWSVVRDLERSRPLRSRVLRGGGLVYEVLGPPDGARHPAVSPPNRYDPSPP